MKKKRKKTFCDRQLAIDRPSTIVKNTPQYEEKGEQEKEKEVEKRQQNFKAT